MANRWGPMRPRLLRMPKNGTDFKIIYNIVILEVPPLKMAKLAAVYAPAYA